MPHVGTSKACYQQNLTIYLTYLSQVLSAYQKKQTASRYTGSAATDALCRWQLKLMKPG